MRKIMILGASILQVPAIQKAVEMGYEVIAVDMNPEAIGFSIDGVIPEVVSTIDIPGVVACARKHRINGVMTLASDMPMRTVAAVAKDLELVGIDEDTALRATNKAYMRMALQKYEVPIPRFFRVSNYEKYLKAVSNFCEPFIVKPADNSGSRGIMKISNFLDKKKVSEAYDYSRSFSRNGDVVVEEYMVGPEVSVETLTVNGECNIVQITDKLTTGDPYFVEMGHTQPSCLNDKIKKEIINVTQAANRAVGITNGPSHTEIIVTANGPKIVELGARLGGDCITTHLVPLSTGVDMVECCIKIALGETPDIKKKFEKSSAIRYFNSKAGRIVSIDGLNDAKNISGVKQISFVYGVGQVVKDIRSSSDRIGFVISQGDTVEQAVDVCNTVQKVIRIGIEEKREENW